MHSINISKKFQILKGLQHFRYDNLSTDLMIHMGLMNVLINRLELGIKDLKETHNTDRQKTSSCSGITMRERDDDDDDIEMTFPKRVKMEFTPPRYTSVRTQITILVLCLNAF